VKALFITTETADCANHVRSWASAFGPPAVVTYDLHGLNNDWRFTEAAERERPRVIVYIGADKARGNPRIGTLIELRKIAPVVLICSDAGDKPWHAVLTAYRTHNCFDLRVSIDGANDAPVDLATLTPVDAGPFGGPSPVRDIRCGFSGTVGHWNPRSEIIRALEWFAGLTVRDRQGASRYEDHVMFLRRCRMLLNISFTGTAQAHHVKGRVLEAGWAGCCLLESAGSPIGEWFPEDCYITYRDPVHAAELIRELDDVTIERAARRLAEEVRARFTARQVWGGMLERIGLVADPVTLAAS